MHTDTDKYTHENESCVPCGMGSPDWRVEGKIGGIDVQYILSRAKVYNLMFIVM